MKKTTDNRIDAISDDESASDLYRSVPAERAPPHLNSTVLNLAAREARKDAWYSGFIPWLRPAAFVATVGLSLAVLLEINDSSNTTNGLPAATPAAVVLDEFASAAADSSSRIRRIGETAAERELDSESGANAYVEPKSLDAGVFCDDEQSATPESWRRCIERLRAEGQMREANSELARFREAYPDVPFNEE